MGLPAVNPLSAGWVNKGAAFDHLGATTIDCAACGKQQTAERYRLLVGHKGGFGAPVYVKPFLKKASTAGKIGGTKGVFTQCTGCTSMWPEDNGAHEILSRYWGITAGGLIAPQIRYEYENRQAQAAEPPAPEPGSSASRVRKMPDEA